MLNRHNTQSSDSHPVRLRRMIVLEAWLMSLVAFRIPVFRDDAIPVHPKLFSIPSCGVASDFLQSVIRSVSYLPASVGIPLLAASFLVSAELFSGDNTRVRISPPKGGPPNDSAIIHSNLLLKHNTGQHRVEILVDRLNCSPRQKNRAGVYEKGDCNQ